VDYQAARSSRDRFVAGLVVGTFGLAAGSGLSRTFSAPAGLDLRWLGLATLLGSGLSVGGFLYRLDRYR